MHITTVLAVLLVISTPVLATEGVDFWMNVNCHDIVEPDNCDMAKIPLMSVEDIERCAPARLPLYARNYFLGWAGRGITYKENRAAFNRIFIRPRVLRDISNSTTEITTLGQKVSFPVGIAPSALHKLADPLAEKATAAAAAALNTIFIQSSYSSMRIEDVANFVKDTGVNMWLQLYVFKNINYTIELVRRAEKAGFKALVLTVDSYVFPPIFCDGKHYNEIANARLANIPVTFAEFEPAQMSFNDIKWLRSITKLPIVAKGVLTGEDAVSAINAGATAVIVSNHGGRQLDGLPASIDALTEVVKAVSNHFPKRDVYLDGGVRNGYDVYKALARGAKMVFIGRPALWGLTMEGQRGVERVLEILRDEFNTTMLMSGHANPAQINGKAIIPTVDDYN